MIILYQFNCQKLIDQIFSCYTDEHSDYSAQSRYIYLCGDGLLHLWEGTGYPEEGVERSSWTWTNPQANDGIQASQWIWKHHNKLEADAKITSQEALLKKRVNEVRGQTPEQSWLDLIETSETVNLNNLKDRSSETVNLNNLKDCSSETANLNLNACEFCKSKLMTKEKLKNCELCRSKLNVKRINTGNTPKKYIFPAPKKTLKRFYKPFIYLLVNGPKFLKVCFH